MSDNKIYENWHVYHPNGKLMFLCNEKRAKWYLNRGIAFQFSSESIQLLFQPKSDGDPLHLLGGRENKCVVCGTEENLTKHHVVPSQYRTHLPLKYKDRNFVDILPMCRKCHDDYEYYLTAIDFMKTHEIIRKTYILIYTLMKRVTKHTLKFTNGGKLKLIDKLFSDYKDQLQWYIDLIINEYLPLKKNLSSKDLPSKNITHSRWKQIVYKDASEIVRSLYKKNDKLRYKRYKKVYAYFKKHNRQKGFLNKKFTELNIKHRWLLKPNVNNVTINLDQRVFDIQDGKVFDEFVRLNLPYFKEKIKRSLTINLPIKHHKHSNQYKGYKRLNTVQLRKVKDNYYLHFIYELPVVKRESGSSLGIDIGYKKLLALSDGTTLGEELFGLYDKISKKKQGSKNFKQLLTHRDNLINYYVNQVDLDGLKTIVIEDLVNVKHGSKSRINNKLQRWSYRKTIDKINRTCEVNGLTLVKVSPAYTSQTCSKCGNVDKESRNGELYFCKSCGYQIDSDINAAINIHNRGSYSPSNKETIS